MPRTTLARTAQEVDRLRSGWESLERQPGATLFQSFRWNQMAARRLDAAPFVVLAETSGGAAIIPAALHRDAGCISLLGDLLFDYRDVLADDDEALGAAWRRLADEGLPLRFTALHAGSSNDCWSATERADFTGAPAAALADISADAFAAQHARLARQVRRLQRAGAEFVRCTGGDSPLVRWIYEQKARQLANAPDNIFADPARVDFMVSIAAAEAERCEIFCFRRGSDIVSALVTFRDGATRRFYTIYFDRAWGHYSPGTALVYEVACRSLREGLDCDFMTGEQPHKVRLATRFVPLYRVSASVESIARMADFAAGFEHIAA